MTETDHELVLLRELAAALEAFDVYFDFSEPLACARCCPVESERSPLNEARAEVRAAMENYRCWQRSR